MNFKDGINEVTNLRKNISDFINSQNIIGTISGVTVAVSTGNTIRSFVNEIIFPSFYYIFRKNIKVSEFTPISYEHISIFGKELFTFLMVLVFTYYFVKLVMANLFDSKIPSLNSNSNATNALASGLNNRKNASIGGAGTGAR
jgi:large-conductance mechanosensitive channel